MAASGRIIIGGRIKQVNISSFLFIILKSAGARVQYNSAPPLIYTVREIGIIIAAGVIIIFLIVLAVRLLIRFRKNKIKTTNFG
jgi:hypothetical protein